MIQSLFCKNLKKFRHQQNWKRDQLAQRLGVSVATVSKIESGSINVSLSCIERIADVYGVPMTELFNPDYSHLNILKNKLAACEKEIWLLQGRIIELYEELLHETATPQYH